MSTTEHPQLRARRRGPVRRTLGWSARWIGHVVLLCAWLLIAVMAVVTWLPHITSVRTDIIIGSSMEPTIPLYSAIFVEPTSPYEIRRGDVITFQRPDQQDMKVTHRVAEVVEGAGGTPAFITRGDNNTVRDPWRVEYSGTAYRVRGHVPHVGWLMLKAQTPTARVALVVIPTLVLLLQFLLWLWRGERGPDEEGADIFEEELPPLVDDPFGAAA